MAKKVGKPKMGKYEVPYMIQQIKIYTQSKKDSVPILKECCLENEWAYDYVMELQRKDSELRKAIRMLLDLKEVKLEQGMISGQLKTAGAIFSLKQMGWRDRYEISNTDEVKKVDELLSAIKIIAADGEKDEI